MSATSEHESLAPQDYGAATSSEKIYERLLDRELTNSMDVPSARTPVLRAVPTSPTQGDPEPDSTNPESIIQTIHKVDKEVEYHISEKGCDAEMSVDSLSRIVRLEDTTIKNVGRIAYPIIKETEDPRDSNFVENAATLLQSPLNTAIVQNATKLPQNFTINVDAAVGNITAIQNVSQDVGNQTLWLPTILATSADAKHEEDRPPNVSQIIITSESYLNDTSQAGRRTNIITETSYISRPKTSKVQILSNISLPKNTNYPQQYVAQSKEITAPMFSATNHVYKLSTNVVSQKHINNSVLCTKPSKSQSLIGCTSLPPTVINNSPIKNVSYSHTFTKSTNLNKSSNKVNNGANLNAMVAASTGSTQCHILSRVVSGPNKLSVHSGRKSVNTLKGSKNSQVPTQKNQSRAIKIIQQTGSAHKLDTKPWAVSNVTYKSQQLNYEVDSNKSKIIQKVGSPTSNKSQQTMPLQKMPKGERLLLQSPCGPVLLSTGPISTSLPKGPHYVQSGTTPNLRYVQTYGPADNQLSTISQVSANQQLTAQILQSLGQPKIMLHATPTPILPVNHHISPPTKVEVEPVEIKPVNQKRIVFGDKSTLLTADDIVGMEERPNLTEELRRYSIQALAIIMLDHTYALPMQKQPIVTSVATPVTTVAPTVSSPTITTAPSSPLKRMSPVIMSTASVSELPQTDRPVPTSAVSTPIPVSTVPIGTLNYKPQPPPPQDDDAASIISSVEGDRKCDAPRGGSDTETAPEGEEEGKTRCICDFTHDDGYMICCDRCGEWQHVDCMGIDRQNIPDSYMCELCLPRQIDRRHARAIQLRKREELSALGASDSDSSECGRLQGGPRRKRLLTVTTYTDTSGSCVTTYNSNAPVLPPLPQPAAAVAASTAAAAPLPKRGPKKPKKPEVIRKGTKRKLSEKKLKRKKEMLLNRNKYSSSVSTQSHWQDSYELAVTNHYSPELRAKIMKYSSKLGTMPNLASAITAHLCTTVPHAGGKILIATKDLKDNMPVIELRGKYMLSNQHRPQLQNSARAGSQKPGPFVFFYRLPKDNTQICIDTRTYGNEARFVRRSCKPNAELQHCIVKGALHVYLVTISAIQSDTEITVGHDTNGSKQPCACGNPKHCKVNGLNTIIPRKSLEFSQREKRSRNRCFSSSSPVSPPLSSLIKTPIKEISFTFSDIKTDKKSPIKHEYPPMSPVKEILPLNFDEPKKTEPLEATKPEMQEIDLLAKEEMKPDIDEPDFIKVEPKAEIIPEELHSHVPEPTCLPEPVKTPIKEDTKEDLPVRKVPVIKSKFDEFEIKEEFLPFPEPVQVMPVQIVPALPIKPVQVVETPKLLEPIQPIEPVIPVEPPPQVLPVQPPPPVVVEKAEAKPEKVEEKKPKEEVKVEKVEEERPLTREFVAKSACHDRSSRSSRTACVNHDSMDDKTDDSQDKIPINKIKDKEKRKMTREERKMEAIMKAFERMEKAEQRRMEVKERQKRRESDPHPNSFDKDDEDEVHYNTKKRKRRKGRARTTSQSNRRRLNSADSDMVTSGDEATPMSPPRMPSLRPDPPLTIEPERSHDIVSEDLGLSSACLLVEAAVGSVESAFKLPKTKKTMATEWVGRSPERTPSPYNSPYRPTLVSAPSLESLVRVASTMIGDLSGGQDLDHEEDLHTSPPRTPGRERNRPPKKAKRITRSTAPAEVPDVATPVMPQHSAKKRWLRQAISEESDSPSTGLFPQDSHVCLYTKSESPPNEMVTPLKKRRLARESLSCEAHTIVPVNLVCHEDTSPILTSEDSPVKEDALALARQYKRNIMDMYSRDRTRSDSGQGSDDQCNMDNDVLNVNIKGPHDTEHIRRIIGVPTPEEEVPPDLSKPDDITINNNNVDLDEIGYNKVVPMEIDTTVITQSKLDSNENSNDIKGMESPNDKVNSSQSADTSGNSSPQRDEMDDIQKKIHSFHTENILILKSRNKKPPKEKRKKVNLNFDLSMVDDRISIQLRTENDSSVKPEMNGDHGEPNGAGDRKMVSPENIPLPPVETIPLPATELIPLPQDPGPLTTAQTIPLPQDPTPMPVVPPLETIPLPDGPMKLEVESEAPDTSVASLAPALAATTLLATTPTAPALSTTKPTSAKPDTSTPVQTSTPVISTSKPTSTPSSKPSAPVIKATTKAAAKLTSSPKRTSSPKSTSSPKHASSPKPTFTSTSVPISTKTSSPKTTFTTTPKPTPVATPKSTSTATPEVEESPGKEAERPTVLASTGSTLPFSTRFSSTGLFSGIFSNMSSSFKLDSPINENIPNMSIIKSAIDRTTSLDNSLFDKDKTAPVDDLKSVQEILTRVNNMDSNNSVLLSGVLNSSTQACAPESPKPSKAYCPRATDPRLNPPPAEKPKPVRRKLSITEYRKRHAGAPASAEASPAGEAGEADAGADWSSGSTGSSGSGAGSLSPQRLEAAAAAAVDDLEQRLHREFSTTHLPKGVFDAQPTASELQRENLSLRLRREFGLALPEDEAARPPTEPSEPATGTKRCDR